MNEDIETIKYRGLNINISHDYNNDCVYDMLLEDPSMEIYTWIDNCIIGDREETQRMKKLFGAWLEADDYEEYKDEAKEKFEKYHVFPLDAYIHGGVALSLSGEGTRCRWDTSTCVGVLLVERQRGRRTSTAKKMARQYLDQWNDYLLGAIYNYSVENSEGEMIGGCGGFLGFDHEESGLLGEARGDIDVYIEQKTQEHKKQVRAYIKKSIPLIYREPLKL